MTEKFFSGLRAKICVTRSFAGRVFRFGLKKLLEKGAFFRLFPASADEVQNSSGGVPALPERGEGVTLLNGEVKSLEPLTSAFQDDTE
jgi:hypothetical protein